MPSEIKEKPHPASGVKPEPFKYLSSLWIVDGAEVIWELLKTLELTTEMRERVGVQTVVLYLSMFLGVYMTKRKFSVDEAVEDLRYQLADFLTQEYVKDDMVYVDSISRWLTGNLDEESGENEPEAKVDLDLTLDGDDDVPLIRPKKRKLPLPLREPSTKEKERAAKAIGSLFVQTGGKRGFQLKHTLLPTGGGPWAEICRDQALIWTGRLQAGVEAGTITKEQYDGHQITPEEWNMGGSTPFLSLRLGPDRRSHYQTFSRKQRQRFKEALKGERAIPPVVVSEEKSSNRDVLEAELRGTGAKRKRAAVIEDQPLVSAVEEESKHEVPHPDMELSDHDEKDATIDELIRMGRTPKVDVWEDRCPECGGEKDELAQVCPTCMRAGHVPTQDLDATQRVEEVTDEIVEFAPLPLVLPAPVIPFTFKQKVHRKVADMTKEVERELRSVPPDGDPHIIPTALLANIRLSTFWNQSKTMEYPGLRQDLPVIARATLLAVVQVAVFIVQSDEIVDEGMAIVKQALSYDLIDLLGLFFWDKPLLPGWNLYPSAREWDLLGIDESKWREIKEKSELVLSTNLENFIIRVSDVWKGDELRPHATKGEIEELAEHAVLIARVRLLFGALVQTLVVAHLELADLGAIGKKNLERQTLHLRVVSRTFQDLKQSRKKNPLTLAQTSFKVQATFIDNLKMFLAGEE